MSLGCGYCCVLINSIVSESDSIDTGFVKRLFVYTFMDPLNGDVEEYNKGEIYDTNNFTYDTRSAYENGVGSIFA